MAGETETPNIGLQVPAFNQANWQVPTNFNWNLLDQIFGGEITVPALNVTELTVGSIVGLTIPFGMVVVPYSATPVFNASLGQEFKIVLTGNVVSSTVINTTTGPAILAFRIVQDPTGGRVFTWPASVRNAGTIDATSNARSLQLFAVDQDGSLDAIGPMMYS